MERIKAALGLTVDSIYARYTIVALLGIPLLVIVTIILLFQGRIGYAVSAITAALTVVSLLALLLGIPMGRAICQEIEEMISTGTYWACWKYTPQEWDHFMQGAWERSQKDALTWAIPWLVLGPILGIMLLFAGGLATALISMLVVSGVGGAIYLVTFALTQSDDKKRDQSMRTIYIIPRGIYQPGRGFNTFFGVGVVLRRVNISGGQPPLVTFTTFWRQGRAASWYGTGTEKNTSVPIPRGCEVEAKKLVERFQDLLGNGNGTDQDLPIVGRPVRRGRRT